MFVFHGGRRMDASEINVLFGLSQSHSAGIIMVVLCSVFHRNNRCYKEFLARKTQD